MASQSSDPIAAAMIETEKEVAGFAWDNEDTEAADPTGDRSLEDLGEGLEGQHEAGDDDEPEGDESEGEEESDGDDADGKTTEDEDKVVAAKEGNDAKSDPKTPLQAEQPQGRVPPGKHREALERARTAEAERDTFKTQLTDVTKTFGEKLDAAMRRIDDLSRTRTEPPKAADPPKPEVIPDIFEDPKGFAEHLTKGFQTELSKRDQQFANQRVETSMAIAHAFHKDTFEKAFDAINKLNVQNPDDRAAVQRIYNSPNPGEALVGWHKRQQTLAEVGDDPTAYRERIAKETREALMKDPEFKKQLVAELRGEANRGDDGTPRTTTRLPRSLARAQGSNIGAERIDPNANDGSPEEIANAAWR